MLSWEGKKKRGSQRGSIWRIKFSEPNKTALKNKVFSKINKSVSILSFPKLFPSVAAEGELLGFTSPISVLWQLLKKTNLTYIWKNEASSVRSKNSPWLYLTLFAQFSSKWWMFVSAATKISWKPSLDGGDFLWPHMPFFSSVTTSRSSSCMR